MPLLTIDWPVTVNDSKVMSMRIEMVFMVRCRFWIIAKLKINANRSYLYSHFNHFLGGLLVLPPPEGLPVVLGYPPAPLNFVFIL